MLHRHVGGGRDDVGGEVEAWLAGHSTERTRKRWTPGWVWLNALAHGNRDEISTLANQRRLWGRDRTWREARRPLAQETLAVAGDQLEDLQREVLVPLQLRLVAEGDTARIEPYQLAAGCSSQSTKAASAAAETERRVRRFRMTATVGHDARDGRRRPGRDKRHGGRAG